MPRDSLSSTTLLASLIQNICGMVHDKYTILDKDTSDTISLDTFIKSTMVSLLGKEKLCAGTLCNGKPCMKAVADDKDFCATHLRKRTFVPSQQMNSTNSHVINVALPSSREVPESMKRVFVQDSFYLSDEEFLYDPISLLKVGVRKGDQYELTCDPLELDHNVFSRELESILTSR
jgi:hypothetical protein